ncbi:unnamed protein product [Didymodactylos carnosus]|uniref:Uncharacterized protein n=1 Tax=Didymodactylos carnosus TaxID=1234261 RepID=A0A8S2RS70_9BILA|nr:unnamed protein product [Didymodactylos carnosus]CAF4179350.1 unnamed protein product [Didymodactylos carnosus]
MSTSSTVRPSISGAGDITSTTNLSRPSIQLYHSPRLNSTIQHLNNGCIPSTALGRLSQADIFSQTFAIGGVHSSNTNLKCGDKLQLKLKYYLITLLLTVLLAFLLITTIELSMQTFHMNTTTKTNTTTNKTIQYKQKIHSYFFCTWVFNFLLLLCFMLQMIIYQYYVSKSTTITLRYERTFNIRYRLT